MTRGVLIRDRFRVRDIRSGCGSQKRNSRSDFFSDLTHRRCLNIPDKRSRPLRHLLPHLLLIVLCLRVPHLIVFAVRILYQLFVAADLNQGALVEYRDLFAEAAGGEAV